MVSFTQAVRLGFQQFFKFSGRSTRAEYWWFFLFLMMVILVLAIVDQLVGTWDEEIGQGLLSDLFAIGTLVPRTTVAARRLHDINKSGWWQLLWFGVPISLFSIPWLAIIPVITMIVWAARPGDTGANRYG